MNGAKPLLLMMDIVFWGTVAIYGVALIRGLLKGRRIPIGAWLAWTVAVTLFAVFVWAMNDWAGSVRSG